MYIVKPGFVKHPNDKGRATPIYSLSVHPKGGKLATGGQDTKVRIWSVKALLDPEESVQHLSTLAFHNGVVLCVRWSNIDGRYIASGSDDQKIVISMLQPQQDPSVRSNSAFGGTSGGEKNVETYKPVRILAGHESDVCDLAWSPDNEYLASCSFDSSILIWSGSTFERIAKLSGHSGFVKGLTWDPVGKYLASSSDDKTTKIWRQADWKVENSVSRPYSAAVSNTFFRRPSWAPDGSCILTANGESDTLPIAPIISRHDWSSEISLIGHTAPIESCQFNPILFEMEESSNGGSADPSSANHPKLALICALGSQDHGISIWSTLSSRPIASAKDVFKHSVLDCAWSPDGLCLFSCSYDGSVVALEFEAEEFGIPVPVQEKDRILGKLGHKKAIIPESTSILAVEEEAKRLNASSTTSAAAPVVQIGSLSGKPIPTAVNTEARQIQTVTKDGKKRIQPILLAPAGDLQGSGSSSTPIPNAAVASLQETTTGDGTSVSCLGKRSRSDDAKGMPSVEFILPTVTASKASKHLGVPAIQSTITKLVRRSVVNPQADIVTGSGDHGQPEKSYHISVKNSVQPVMIICTEDSTVCFVDHAPDPVLHVVGGDHFFAFATSTAAGSYLLAVSSLGSVTVWNMTRQNVIIESNILHLLEDSVFVAHAILKLEGVPVLTLSNGNVFTFHTGLRAWMDVTKKSGKSIQALENTLASSLSLLSPRDYRITLNSYARKLADGNCVAKATELCDMLLGPTSPSASESWEKNVLGMPKRDLLREILPVLATNRQLQRVVAVYEQTLKSLLVGEVQSSLFL